MFTPMPPPKGSEIDTSTTRFASLEYQRQAWCHYEHKVPEYGILTNTKEMPLHYAVVWGEEAHYCCLCTRGYYFSTSYSEHGLLIRHFYIGHGAAVIAYWGLVDLAFSVDSAMGSAGYCGLTGSESGILYCYHSGSYFHHEFPSMALRRGHRRYWPMLGL